MAAQTITKKRKSIGDATTTVKKAKTVKTAKSVDTPAPIKSALKKPSNETTAEESTVPAAKDVKTKAKAQTEKKTQGKSKPTKATQEPEETIKDSEEGGAELTEDQTAALLAGFSSSEDEASDVEDEGIDTKKLPQAPRTVEIQQRIKQAIKDNPETSPGVLYIGRIPHGFYEHQMRSYFSQFGEITHIRLARNRKTGKSQHYGFMEFSSAAVAEIVAKTMDKYLLFGHLLQVRKVPSEQVSENLWKGGERRKKPAPRNRLEGARLKRGMVREDWDKRVTREAGRRAEKAEKFKEMGYEFDMPALKTTSDVHTKPKQTEAGENAEDVELEAEKALPAEVEVEEPKSVVTRTLQSEPDGVKVTGTKVTKKREAGEAKSKKAKKARV